MIKECDVLVVGGGPGGLAAACAARKEGADSVIVLEREGEAGGILNQCIHSGFGLIRYKEELTGPEYAGLAIEEALSSGVKILTSRHVAELLPSHDVMAYTREGMERYHAKAVILATGCRERTRGNISIPGSRPAGVFTAGVAQNLLNRKNIMVGRRAVILGSGDIGLIMARRLTLEGAKVLAVAEILSAPAGLARNVSQCVYEFGIPLYVNTTVSNIIGKNKLEAVELSEVDKNHEAVPGTGRILECDTLILSVGLIPENEVAKTAGIKLNEDNSMVTDKYLQTSAAGIFSCGNSRHVMDLADYVSEQGETAGRNAVHLLRGEPMEAWDEGMTNCMKKGFPEKDTVTCTVCPNGCQVKWNDMAGRFVGNKCPRGAKFAQQERTDPKRTVTTTVKVRNGHQPLIAVRTKMPVKKAKVEEIMKELHSVAVDGDVKTNDIVCTLSSKAGGVPVIATADVSQDGL